MLVEAFGYKAETTQPSHDYGVDVVAENQRRRVVIQCKLYGRGCIGGDTIMQLVGSRAFFEATDAICITTSYFTKQARAIAVKQNIYLVDQKMLLGLCREKGLTIPSLTMLDEESGNNLKMHGLRVTIGRTDDNDYIIADPQVSRQHAVLERAGLRLLLRDCGSTNGTFVDDQRVAHTATLNYGNIIRIGARLLQVTFRLPEH
jgi:hypothetical protein